MQIIFVQILVIYETKDNNGLISKCDLFHFLSLRLYSTYWVHLGGFQIALCKRPCTLIQKADFTLRLSSMKRLIL